MRRHTLVGCAGAAVLLASALVLVQRPAREVRRYQNDMTARLRALADAQAAHRERVGRYAATPAEAGVAAESRGVRLVVTEATDSGWSATAGHPATSVVCRLWVGRPARPEADGAPRCE